MTERVIWSKLVFPNVSLIKIYFNVLTYNLDNSRSNCHTYHDEGVQTFKDSLLIQLHLQSAHGQEPLLVQKPILWIQHGDLHKESISKLELCGRLSWHQQAVAHRKPPASDKHWSRRAWQRVCRSKRPWYCQLALWDCAQSKHIPSKAVREKLETQWRKSNEENKGTENYDTKIVRDPVRWQEVLGPSLTDNLSLIPEPMWCKKKHNPTRLSLSLFL